MTQWKCDRCGAFPANLTCTVIDPIGERPTRCPYVVKDEQGRQRTPYFILVEEGNRDE